MPVEVFRFIEDQELFAKHGKNPCLCGQLLFIWIDYRIIKR